MNTGSERRRASPADILALPHRITLQSGLPAYQEDIGAYWVDFVPGNAELAVTFENAGGTNPLASRRDCWGMPFLKKRGSSVLGIKCKASDWYRSPEIHRFFRSARFHDFATCFDKVTFMGGSMGGYAALVFSEVVPGSLVIAHNPQSTVDERIVPWEGRFDKGRRQDWTGDFADAGAARLRARRIYITYDPFDRPDRLHVERLSGDNIVLLKIPFLGHRTPEWLLAMKVLTEVTSLAMDEALTPAHFAALVRARRQLPRYYVELYERVRKPRFKDLVLRRGLAAFPRHGGLLLRRIVQQFNLGLYEESVAAFRALAPEDLPRARYGEALAYAGLALCQLGGREAEIGACAAQVNHASTDAAELLVSSRFLNAIGDHETAGALARAAVALAPFQGGGYVEEAKSLLAQNRGAAALDVLAKAREKLGRLDAKMLALRNEIDRQ